MDLASWTQSRIGYHPSVVLGHYPVLAIQVHASRSMCMTYFTMMYDFFLSVAVGEYLNPQQGQD